jgi:hypothetical protein
MMRLKSVKEKHYLNRKFIINFQKHQIGMLRTKYTILYIVLITGTLKGLKKDRIILYGRNI